MLTTMGVFIQEKWLTLQKNSKLCALLPWPNLVSPLPSSAGVLKTDSLTAAAVMKISSRAAMEGRPE